MASETALRVEAYAGASYPERPRALWRRGQRLEVRSVLRSWRTPDALHFTVELESGQRLQIAYRPASDTWWRLQEEEPA